MRNCLLLALALLVLSACSSRKQMNNSEEKPKADVQTDTQNNDAHPEMMAFIDMEAFRESSDPIQINGASISGDILSIDVRYSGGCEEHEFELIGSGMFMKSLPPKMAISLKHNANSDGCRKLIETSLKFNVKDLRYAGEGPLILLLEGTDEITYRY